MNYTNVNIKSGDKSFKYIVEYLEENKKSSSNSQTRYFNNSSSLFFYNELENNVLANKNTWKNIYKEDTKTYNDTDILPNITNLSTFNLYFPRFSVDTYVKNVHYILTINTWVNGVCIYLGSYLIDRRNAIAPNIGIKKFLNEEYYEYVSVNTINPLHLNYSDEWAQFRQVFCGEKIEDGLQKNNSASNINITLTPVKMIDGMWIKLDDYDSSQSVIPISDTKNYLSANLKFDNLNGKPEFNCNITFNPVYNGDFELYLKETYQIFGDVNLKYGFVIGDKENPYKYIEKDFTEFETSVKFELSEFTFDSWQDFFEGLYAQVYFIVQKEENDIIVIASNKVFITQEEFKYLMHENIRTVDLSKIDMELKSFDVVNVIENKVVSVEHPSEYKSNIVKPIFVKVQDTDSIRLHRGVTENISINLDAYKNKVSAFMLKIGDMNFYEIGRMNSGIIFKIVGNNLPSVDGIYYVLNESGELVTTGKYSIV
jgi:hypothetical protein